jgi:LacI family transcriptional regulator
VIVPFSIDRGRVRDALNAGIALTMLHLPDAELREMGVDFIEIDTGDGARIAVDYLIERGHSRIGMIAGIANTPPREMRLAGYRKALKSHGLPADDLLIRGADYQEAGGHEAMVELLKLDHRPTAVFAANDLMAMGAMMAIREAGLRIPEDIAIVGLDDIPAAKLVHPPLTTVAQFPERLGLVAAELLFSRLNGAAPATGRALYQACELIVRNSA